MAKIFLVRDGPSGDHHTSAGCEVNIKKIVSALGRYETRFFQSGPEINPEIKTSEFSPYKHVVVEVGVNETGEKYSNAGFYYIVGLGPTECQELLSISIT